jgi:uncharacterized protein (DUF342 family)
MSDLQFTIEAKEIYRKMVNILLMGSGDERNKKLQFFDRELEKQEDRIAKLKDLLV